MTVDCEYEVAVQAIKLLTAILKYEQKKTILYVISND